MNKLKNIIYTNLKIRVKLKKKTLTKKKNIKIKTKMIESEISIIMRTIVYLLG
jgi:hypothetical protein